MERLTDTLLSLKRYVVNMEIGDFLEIMIIAYLVYHIMLWIKTTRAWALLKGLAVILIFWLASYVFRMNTILWLFENIIGFAVTAMIVVLQPEIRKALEELGKRNIISSVLPFDSSTKADSGTFTEKTVNEIVHACIEMSKVKTGALIVIEQGQSLRDYERTGIEVDGLVTSQLLINIFEHNTPLHDGAVIVRGNRVTSATCYLPLTDNPFISKEVGTRHRAGVGISEATDSVTVIVSEQTGKISIAYDGNLERNFDGERLKNRLLEFGRTGGNEPKKKTRRIGRGKDKV